MTIEDLKMALIDLQNELVDDAIMEHIYDYSEYDYRIGTIGAMIDILDDLME